MILRNSRRGSSGRRKVPTFEVIIIVSKRFSNSSGCVEVVVLFISFACNNGVTKNWIKT